ncbi:MAG: GNAT family N-acetyltransferase [Hyphomicrobiales bacterium]|nr:GNAT family N-acetyltransferase [Hyphomicrobiales bacterium]MCP5373357.1 GNAT family N-acetyltransferase [Hyphomicrobiales bacterium]
MDIRPARIDDLPAIVALLADDPLGATRERAEDPLPQEYHDAFAAVAAQAGNELLVVEDDGQVVGCMQLTFIPGLSRQGATRAQIESVRVRSDRRGQKIGEALFRHAINRARARGAGLVQLTTDLERTDARRFYERLGFQATHLGMKMAL